MKGQKPFTLKCPVKPCAECFSMFEWSKKRRRFCSLECNMRNLRRKQRGLTRDDKPCVLCGRPVTRRRVDGKGRPSTCSPSCASILREIFITPPKPPSRDAVCTICGKPTATVGTLYCSPHCRKLGAGWANQRMRKKARKRMEEAHRIDRGFIYARDKWTCHLCGKKVDSKLEWPNPKCASLDHLVPLSKGGAHIASNVRLAHLECNTKRKTGPAQLILPFVTEARA